MCGYYSREYIYNIALTRSFLQPKIHQISYGGWAPPRPAGGDYSTLPDPLAWFRGSTSKGERKRARRGRGYGRGRKRMGLRKKGGVEG